jgi:hypothetical protein
MPAVKGGRQMTRRIMQLQVVNPHATAFAVDAGRRNQFAADLARQQRGAHRSASTLADRSAR